MTELPENIKEFTEKNNINQEVMRALYKCLEQGKVDNITAFGYLSALNNTGFFDEFKNEKQ